MEKKDKCKNGHLLTSENLDRRNRCKICYRISNKKWRDKNREKKNNDNRSYYYNNKEKVILNIEKSRLKRQYGITIEEYERMIVEQNNLCAICGKEETEKYGKLAIDHDHNTGIVRGLLCHKCNRGLGCFDESEYILSNAIKYLLKNRKEKK